MGSSSTSSVQKIFKYDVFLSFRGEDTRKTFVDHLYRALEDRGIITYKDDEKIKKGKRITDELMGSIEDSKFYVIVFSKNYVSSSWCLDELVKIMECQRLSEHTAYPIFYDVEPTEIRKQSGCVDLAFARHEKEEGAGKWRAAMREAADMAGWELKNVADGYEAKFIQKIVKDISLELRYIGLRFDGKLVGMETRVKDVVSSLEIHMENVRMIGISGIGGGGKTTLARAVFDQISMEFEGSTFVENVREVSNDSCTGLKSLQKQVLADVLNDQGVSVSGVSDGKNKLKRTLSCRKVLVVLDDVDRIEQLEALAGDPNWFKSGSRVIIITRDQKVLSAHRVDFILNVNLLSDEEAICLFSRYAFGKEIPIQGYEELSKVVVSYASGLPLTLKVLGSHLYGESDDVWRDALERLKTIPWKETMNVLEISYNGLEDDYKEIFLDVACIMKGWKKDDAITALESCGFRAKIGLRVLEQKSLINISKYEDHLSMHDHIEEMGKHIVRHLHPNEPYKHSRLWIQKEIKDIFNQNQGTEATRCIYLQSWDLLPNTAIMNGLLKMTGLRFLHLGFHKHQLLGEYSQYLPNSLQYLSWEWYPFTCLPKNCQVNNVFQLQMSNNNIRQYWDEGERKVLDKLTYINLSCSNMKSLDLRSAPNLRTLIANSCYNLMELRSASNLETLILKSCYNLVGLNFDMQDKLKYVDLSDTKLTSLNILPTTNLETLILRSCRYLEELYMEGKNPNLKFLDLSYSIVRIVHLGESPNLELLSLERCINLEELYMNGETPKLKFFDLSHSMRIVHLGSIPNLEFLSLDGCRNLEQLHMSIESTKVKSLEVIHHPKLKTLNLWPSLNLEKLEILGSKVLVELHMPAELKSLSLIDCCLRTLNLERVRKLEEIIIYRCDNLSELIMPVESLELKTLYLSDTPKLTTVDLAREPNLEELFVSRDIDLVKFNMPVASLKLKSNYELRTPNLELLKFLEHGHLVKLPLHSLRCLRKLTLDGCFQEVPKDLQEFECMEKLSLSSERIKHLPSTICMLKHLKVLKLTNSYLLEQLPEDLGTLEHLEKLILSSKKIKHLPSRICMLKYLKVLDLTGCYLLEQLPEDIHRLESLEKLLLSSEMITHLPSSICMLKHLKVLCLKGSCYSSEPMLLEHLPEDIGRLQNLVELSLSSNMIKHIPKSICMLKHLKILQLENCYLIEQLPEDLGRLECLETLNLKNCIFLRDIPNSICQMKHLETLDLSYCFLVEKLPEELGLLKCLKALYIEGAGITHLPQSLFQLEDLYIDGSTWRLESYGLEWIEVSVYSRYSARCYI